MKTFSIQFRYDDRKFGPSGRTLQVKASNQQVAVSRGTRMFLGSLSRKERFDANKKLSILSFRNHDEV